MPLGVVRLGQPTGAADIRGAVDAAGLRDDWRRISLESGWCFPQDWWAPAVDAVVEALLAGRDPAAAGIQLGAARADAGVGMAEALDDIHALYAALESAITPAAEPDDAGGAVPQSAEVDSDELDLSVLMRSVAVGWADHAAASEGGTPCEDALTRLATSAYLRTRLAELYREAERSGRPIGTERALVVVALDDRSTDPPVGRAAAGERGRSGSNREWDRVVRMVVVADAMRATFSGGETLASIGSGHAVACVGRDELLPRRVGLLRELVERQRLADPARGGLAIRAWVEGLPTSLPAALALLDDLRR